MTPSAALAQVVLDELMRLGVRDVVLAPGSRSAPFAYALHAADAAGSLRLHVRVDERSAAFLALGIAKATGVPAPIITTSGTAVVNLYPAVLEAHESGVPMLLLTADRPPELRGTRANQTTDQLGLFGSFARWFHDLGVPEARPAAQASWRTAMDRALAAATGATGGDPGPVHINVPLRDPLAPQIGPTDTSTPEWPESLDGRTDGSAWTHVARTGAAASYAPSAPESLSSLPASVQLLLPQVDRTLVVLGDAPDSLLEAAIEWAARRGHPVIGEPFGRWHEGRLPHGVRVAERAGEPDLRPDRILAVGRITLSRSLARLMRLPQVRVDLVTGDARWPDPGHVVHAVHGPEVVVEPSGGGGGVAAGDLHSEAGAFRSAWADAAAKASAQIEGEMSWPSGVALADAVTSALPAESLLFLGSSNGVRHVELVRGLRAAEGGDRAQVVASRGLAGIDGCVSTAAGLALGSGRPTYAFLGDLTFLHDSNGLLIGPDEPRVDLTIVVGNDDGGAIFSDLEYGQADRRQAYPGVLERVFRTPTGTDLAALCAAHGVRHVLASTPEAVHEAVSATPNGITVVEVPLTHRD